MGRNYAVRRALQASPSRLRGTVERPDFDGRSCEVRRRLSRQAGGRALGRSAPRRPRHAASQVWPQAPLRNGTQPTTQRVPGACGGAPNDPPRTRRPTHGPGAVTQKAKQDEREGDSRPAVEPPPLNAPRPHEADAAAALTPISPQRHIPDRRRRPRRRWTPLLTAPQPVAVQNQGFANDLARRAAPRAFARPHAGYRWDFVLPALDVHVAWDKPCTSRFLIDLGFGTRRGAR